MSPGINVSSQNKIKIVPLSFLFLVVLFATISFFINHPIPASIDSQHSPNNLKHTECELAASHCIYSVEQVLIKANEDSARDK
ncbi:hypothetical protein KA183_19150 [bacterium]|nr:hypothetical protein [bacterium]